MPFNTRSPEGIVEEDQWGSQGGEMIHRMGGGGHFWVE